MVCFDCIQKWKKKRIEESCLFFTVQSYNCQPRLKTSIHPFLTVGTIQWPMPTCASCLSDINLRMYFWGWGVLLRFKWLQNVNSFFSYPSPVACIIIDGLSDPCCKFGPGFGCCPLRTLLKICFFTPLAWTEPPCPFKFVKRTCLS